MRLCIVFSHRELPKKLNQLFEWYKKLATHKIAARIEMYETVVLPRVTYGVEPRGIKLDERDKLDAM